jgi:hypothetical protein
MWQYQGINKETATQADDITKHGRTKETAT